MRKKSTALIISLALLLAGCGNTDTTEISDTSAAEVTETDVEEITETTETEAETVTETETETETETTAAMPVTQVDYMKETLQADWDDGTSVVSLYAADLNGDGIDELFVSCLLGAGQNGLTYIYDVSEEPKLLCDMGLRMYFSGGGLYSDAEENIHFISVENYSGALWQEDSAYYDVAYNGSNADVKIPFCTKMYDWFDGGAHVFEHKVYTDCGYFSPAVDFRNFDISEGNFWGIYDYVDARYIEKYNDLSDVSDEIKEIIEQSVFDGLTYVSDMEKFYHQEGRTEEGKLKDLTFDEFWESASPVLAEYYADQL